MNKYRLDSVSLSGQRVPGAFVAPGTETEVKDRAMELSKIFQGKVEVIQVKVGPIATYEAGQEVK